MGGLTKHAAWALLLLFCASGCQKQDVERLGKIGRHSMDKAARGAGVVKESVALGWQGGVGGDEYAVAARVLTRLKWDKALADTSIEVTAHGSAVDLKGKVSILVQRQRAVQLAESTTGVEKVNDFIEVTERY